jgi:hypothetical protein
MTPESRRIFRWGILQGSLYMVGETLMDPTLVIVAYLSYLTKSPILLGLVVPIRDGLWYLPQLWVSTYIQSLPRKIVVYQIGTVLNLISFSCITLSINFVRDPHWALISFFTCFVISSAISGLRGLPFMVVISKTIPARRRGEFFAYRLALTGLFSIGASAFVNWILDPGSGVPFPTNFGTLSLCFLVLATISLTMFCLFKEPPDVQVQPRTTLGSQIGRAWGHVKNDKRFSRFLLLSVLVIISGSATPFFAVHVRQKLGGSSEMVGIYLGITMAANLISNLVIGRISRRHGNQKVMIVGNLAGAVMLGLVLALAVLAGPLKISGVVAGYWLFPVFALWGIRNAGVSVSLNSLIMDIAPPHDTALYIGFSNSVQGIFQILAGLSGFIVSLFGFMTLILLTLASQVGGWYLSTRIPAKKQ